MLGVSPDPRRCCAGEPPLAGGTQCRQFALHRRRFGRRNAPIRFSRNSPTFPRRHAALPWQVGFPADAMPPIRFAQAAVWQAQCRRLPGSSLRTAGTCFTGQRASGAIRPRFTSARRKDALAGACGRSFPPPRLRSGKTNPLRLQRRGHLEASASIARPPRSRHAPQARPVRGRKAAPRPSDTDRRPSPQRPARRAIPRSPPAP